MYTQPYFQNIIWHDQLGRNKNKYLTIHINLLMNYTCETFSCRFIDSQMVYWTDLWWQNSIFWHVNICLILEWIPEKIRHRSGCSRHVQILKMADIRATFVSQKISKIRWKNIVKNSLEGPDTFVTGSWDDEVIIYRKLNDSYSI